MTTRQETWISMLRFGNPFTAVWAGYAVLSGLTSHGLDTVIKMPDHASLVQGQIQLLSLLPSVAMHRVETVGFKLGGRSGRDASRKSC